MSRRVTALGVVFQLALIGLSVWAILHRQDIIDWYRLQNYHPLAEVIQLADHDTMVNRGRDLFYASQPSIDDKQPFNDHCSNNGERSLVLGCYRAQRIFVFNVTDPKLDGVKEVTAAHEMLHAAYERLSSSDKQKVNNMLLPVIKNITDKRLLGLIQLYNKQEPGELYNEMHSVLGTEYRNLTPDLEQYYRQYFSDRSKIVGYSEKYEAVFTESKNRIAAYDTQLAALKQQIQNNNSELEQRLQELNQKSAQLNQLREDGQIQQYNSMVPAYNTQVNQFNALLAQTKNLIDEYNALVDRRNQEAVAQNALYESLNSRYQAIPSNQ